MKIYSKSDIGLVRETNQDACYFEVLPRDSAWAIVCDGMGGANAGNLASNLAIEIIKEKMKNFAHIDAAEVAIHDFLIAAVNEANHLIFEKARGDPAFSGMGTTLILAAALKDVVHIVYAGDSRAYFLDESKIKQLTVDHSVVQEMVDSGEITQDQAHIHPKKNIITRAIGINSDVALDYVKLYMKDKNSILLCTDGLTNHVKEEEIFEIFQKNSDIEEFSNELIELAKNDGGSDNITVLLISY